eukprot:115550_1
MNTLRRCILTGIYNMNRYPIINSSIHTTRYFPKYFCTSSETLESQMRNKLESELEPVELQIYDTSGGCGSFFGIEIKSAHFNGKKTFQQHKLVNQILKDEIANVHGITLKTHPTDT